MDCGKPIWVKSKRCTKCHIATRPNWKGGVSVGYKKCIDCGKILGDYYSTRCKSCSKKGELHSNWKGSTSFEPYPLGWSNTFKEQIRYRDEYKCQECGTPEVENGRKLDVHHIDYNKNNIKPSNFISLCRKCHAKTNYHRDYWEKHFKED